MNTGRQPHRDLIQARIERGWTQQEVADRLGVSLLSIGRWERGEVLPQQTYRRRLADLFGISEQALEGKRSRSVASSSLTRFPLHDPLLPLLPAIPLVGRNEDLTQVAQHLCARETIVLTALNGLPGVGKTALAVALCADQKIRKQFHDGILWARLGPTPNIEGELSRWGALVGIARGQTGDEAWGRALREAIGSRSLLLVIDDAWSAEDALHFKIGGPQCAYLLTTRFRDLAAQIAVRGATELKELSEEQSLQLLHQLAPDAITLEMQKARTLVHAVGGLPLALTLIGNYLRKKGYTGQNRRITAALERLNSAEERLKLSEAHTLSETHPSLPWQTRLSLQSILEVSDHMLSAAAREALYALSILPPKPQSFSEEAALAVAQCAPTVVDQLVDAGLVECMGEDRYRLHQVVADYARQFVPTDAHTRLVEHVHHFIRSHAKDYRRLEQECALIETALAAACQSEQQHALFLRILCALAPFFSTCGLYPLAQRFLPLAQTIAARLEDDPTLSDILAMRGQMLIEQGFYIEAGTALHTAMVLARNRQDTHRICQILLMQTTIAWKRAEFAQTKALASEGLTLARQMELWSVQCSFLERLGTVHLEEGEYVQGKQVLQEALRLARQWGSPEQLASTLINLGAFAMAQGDPIGETYFQRSLTLARDNGHREEMCLCLLNLGEFHRERQAYWKAKMYHEEGLVLARQLGHREWLSVILIGLAAVANHFGEKKHARAYFEEGLALARQLGRPRILVNALYEYGNDALQQAELDRAETLFRESLAVSPKQDREALATAHYGLARLAAARNEKSTAKEHGVTSHRLFAEIGHGWLQEVHSWLAQLDM